MRVGTKGRGRARKRRWARVCLRGGVATVVERRSRRCASWRVRDISSGGLALVGGLRHERGPRGDLTLSVWWPGVGRMHCRGRVVRDDGEVIAVEFRRPQVSFATLVGAVADAARDRHRAVVYAPGTSRGALRILVGDFGGELILAPAPLDFVDALVDPRAMVTAILCDDSAQGVALLEWARQEVPGVPRLILGGERCAVARLLASGLVHARIRRADRHMWRAVRSVRRAMVDEEAREPPGAAGTSIAPP